MYQVDAFSEKLFCGNPAAVCPLQNWLPENIMQSIAAENNLSETAFFVEKNDKFFIRWFTPKVEIDLCGHATLAAAHILYSELAFQKNQIAFETKKGVILNVSREKDIINLDFPSCQPKIVDDPTDLLNRALGANPSWFLFGNYGMAVFNDEQDIMNMQPDLNLLAKLEYNGIIVTAPGDHVDFVSRFFGPKLGIPEDPVTGGAHCELIPYWANRLKKKDMLATQLSKRGGQLYCSYLGDRVIMGGKAITYLEGEILI